MRVQSTRRRIPKEIDYADIREIALVSSEFLFFSFEPREEMNKLVVFFVDLEELAFAKRMLIMIEYDSDLSFPSLRRLTMRERYGDR